MANEFDRKILPDILQTTLSVSLGAAYKGYEMMRNPLESVPKVINEMKTMVTPPEGFRNGLPDMVKGVAGVWMEKGVTIMYDCKTAGEKFTEGK